MQIKNKNPKSRLFNNLMKRINKILILFVFLFSLLTMIIWEILQSEYVADKISRVATSYVEKVLKAKIEFKNLEFSLFPPGAEVKNFLLEGHEGNFDFKVRSNYIGIFFSPTDLFNTNFTINEIAINDAKIFFKQKSKKEDKKNKDTGINLDIIDQLKKIPINKISGKNVSAQYDKSKLFVNSIELEKNNDSFDIMGSVSKFDVSFIEELKNVDGVEFKVNLDRSLIKVEDIKIYSNLAKLQFKGEFENYVSKNISYSGKYKVDAPISTLHDWVDLSRIGKFEKGFIKADGKLRGSGTEFETSILLEGRELMTSFIDANNVNAEIFINKKHIVVRRFSLKNGDEKLSLTKPFELLNLKTKKYVEEPIIANLEGVELSNSLKYLKDSLSILEGKISGILKFDLYSNSFKFSGVGPVVLDQFTIKSKESEIIKLEKLISDEVYIYVKNGSLKLNLSLKDDAGTEFDVVSKIGNGEFGLKIPKTFVDLNFVNHIFGYKVEGKGLFFADLYKKDSELTLDLETDFNDFSIEGYNFEKIQSFNKLNFDENKLYVRKLNFSSGSGKGKATGVLNLEDMGLDFNYEISKIKFPQVKRITAPLFKNIEFAGSNVQGEWYSQGELKGRASLDELIIDGEILSQNSIIYDELFDSVRGKYKLSRGVLSLDDFFLRKSDGYIFNDFSFDLRNKSILFALNLNNIAIEDLNIYSKLPIGIQSKINGEFKGSYQDEKLLLSSEFSLNDTEAYSKKYEDSYFSFKLDQDKVSGHIKFLGNEINSKFEYFFNDKQKSIVNLQIKSNDINKSLAIINGYDSLNGGFSGEIDYNFQLGFYPSSKKIEDFKSHIKKLELNRDKINVKYRQRNPEIEVKNGKIKNWNVNVKGRGFYLISSASGDLLREYTSESFLKIDASVLELFNQIFTSVSGNIRAKVSYENSSNKKDNLEAFITSNNLSFNTKILPTTVSNTNLLLSFKNKVLNVEKLKAKLTSGDMSLNGTVNFSNLIPIINIDYHFKNAGLVLKKKSNLVFTADGSLIGSKFPYTLAGDFQIEKLNILNEITDFSGTGGGIDTSDIDFLPGKSARTQNQNLNFNLNISTRDPIYIRNSLADVGFVGNVQVLGGERDPRLNGSLTLASRNNKVTFKNNEFLFSKGDILWNEVESYKNPEVDFNASSNINDYKINVAVVGRVENFNLSLTSEPSLEQADILSLIAFGYTEDLSNNLSESEKESMTRAGVGSIIFDSFKINETLKNEFGVQVNLGTEISQDETSYLEGRSSEGSSNVGRVRSATTFEIKKKLDDNVSMAVKSTVGSSSSQKQAINLNYTLNNNISVEGVYESRSIDEQESINNDTSLGADIKWKWSFK